MKALGILFLAFLLAFVGYQFAYPKLEDFLHLKKSGLDKSAATSGGEQSKITEVEETTSKPKDETVMTDSPGIPGTPKLPEPAFEPSVPKTSDVVRTTKNEAGPDGFVPPTFPPLEEVVKGWKEIPKKVFPRQVKLLRDVEFKMSAGSSRVKAGGGAMAIGQVGENLIVAPTEKSPLQCQVSLADTDLKISLTQAYEAWKVKMLDWHRRQWEFRKVAATNVPNTVSSDPQITTKNDKPKRNSDGSYDILLTSMKIGQVNEITPSNIKKWGEIHLTNIKGKEYYTVIVNYTAKTMFGDFDTEAQAQIIYGKVDKWIYTGSGEVVP